MNSIFHLFHISFISYIPFSNWTLIFRSEAEQPKPQIIENETENGIFSLVPFSISIQINSKEIFQLNISDLKKNNSER